MSWMYTVFYKVNIFRFSQARIKPDLGGVRANVHSINSHKQAQLSGVCCFFQFCSSLAFCDREKQTFEDCSQSY